MNPTSRELLGIGCASMQLPRHRISSLDLGTNRTYAANALNQYLVISTSDAGLQTSEFEPQYDDDMRSRRRRRVARREGQRE